MSKKKKKVKVKKYEDIEDNDREVLSIEMGDFVMQNTPIFAINTALKRFTPDLFDYLIPAHRRLLLGVYDMGLTPKKEPSKSGQIIGEVLKKYHPHGDTLYGTMMTMTQDWRYNLPLLFSPTNNGSAYDPSSYAQQRYTETRMSEFAYKAYFEGWNPPKGYKGDKVTDYMESFAGYPEAQVLPARYPMFLMNFHRGYSMGRYTCTPSFSVKDSCETILKLMDDHDAKIEIYPSDPRGAMICNKSEFKKFFDAEESQLKMRGECTVDHKNGKTYIYIHSVPYEVSPATIEEQIIKCCNSGDFPEINDIGEADKYNTHYLEIELKKGVNPDKVIEKLYKKTNLAITLKIMYGFVNDLQSVDYTPRIACLEWIRIRREYIYRIYQKTATTVSKNILILGGYVRIANEDLSGVLSKVIKNNTEADAFDIIHNKYKFTKYQTGKILNFKLKGFSSDNMQAYKDELAELILEYDRLRDILRSRKKMDAIMREELNECIKLFDTPNKSKVINLLDKSFEVADTDHILLFTNKYVKKVEYQIPYKYGKVDDKIKQIETFNNRDDMLLFTDTGKCYPVKVSDILDASPQSIGNSLVDIKIVDSYVKAVNMSRKDDSYNKAILVTEQGLILKVDICEIKTAKRSIVKLNKGDRVADVVTYSDVDKHQQIVVYTTKGDCVIMHIDEITETKLNTKGVNAISLKSGDVVKGVTYIKNSIVNDRLVIITDRGYMRTMLTKELPRSGRGSKGFSINKGNGSIVSVVAYNSEQSDIHVATTSGELVVIASEINANQRIGGASDRVIELDASNYVISAELAPK